MGLFERLMPRTASVVTNALVEPAMRSPWTQSQLSKVVISELAGIKPGSVTREQLMRIPAVVRGRGLLCGTLSRHPLALFQFGQTAPLEPAVWMTSTATGMSPLMRMLWTVDDLIFSGLSLWATNRDHNGDLVDAIRVPRHLWTAEPSGAVLVTPAQGVPMQPANASEVILFEGPQEGLVTIAEESAAGSRDLSNAWRQRVAAPVPMATIRQTDPNAFLTPDEVDQLVRDVEAARSKSGTVFIPQGYEDSYPGASSTPDLYIAGRNAERLDWANHLQIPAAMLDGSMSTATLTYSTTEGKRSEFVDYSLAYWGSPIEARLSQDDVTLDGTFSRIDLSALTNPVQQGTNPATED